jgi:hypothetical protein
MRNSRPSSRTIVPGTAPGAQGASSKIAACAPGRAGAGHVPAAPSWFIVLASPTPPPPGCNVGRCARIRRAWRSSLSPNRTTDRLSPPSNGLRRHGRTHASPRRPSQARSAGCRRARCSFRQNPYLISSPALRSARPPTAVHTVAPQCGSVRTGRLTAAAGRRDGVVGLARRSCCRSASWWRVRSATTSSRLRGALTTTTREAGRPPAGGWGVGVGSRS